MCGRFTQRSNLHSLAEQFQFSLPADLVVEPRYNIAPTQDVPIVRRPAAGAPRQLALVHWGLIPSWAKDSSSGAKTINARGESVADKPSFRAAFKRRRCLVIADGFYEWKKTGTGKQPYFIHRADDKPFAFAGLWEHWSDNEPNGVSPLESCTIITTEANHLMRPLHDRMPVILDAADYDAWLDPALSDRERLESLLVPYAGEGFAATPVSTFVNNPRHEDSQCVAPLR